MKNIISKLCLLLLISNTASADWFMANIRYDHYKVLYEKEKFETETIKKSIEEGLISCVWRYQNTLSVQYKACAMAVVETIDIYEKSFGKKYQNSPKFDFFEVTEKSNQVCEQRFKGPGKYLNRFSKKQACKYGVKKVVEHIFERSRSLGLHGEARLDCGQITCWFTSLTPSEQKSIGEQNSIPGKSVAIFDQKTNQFDTKTPSIQSIISNGNEVSTI